MKEKIEKEIKDLEEQYDWYLEKTEDGNFGNQTYIYTRLHDIKIEINTYKKVLEMLENE